MSESDFLAVTKVPGISNPKVVLFTTTIAAFMTPFDSNVVNLALPGNGKSLNTELSLLIWVIVTYLLVSASLQTMLGWLGDKGGRMRSFLLV
ncbi:MAG: hypothetical protein JRN15_05565 [Nitrososphaerota archaeon]|nr:hypothetical protein [Nitrososphaerota archaeon]